MQEYAPQGDKARSRQPVRPVLATDGEISLRTKLHSIGRYQHLFRLASILMGTHYHSNVSLHGSSSEEW